MIQLELGIMLADHPARSNRIYESTSSYIAPDIMQSIFGVIFFMFVRRILGKLPANFSANFDGKF